MSLPAAALPPASDGPRIPGYRIDGVMHRSRWRVVLAAQRLSDGAEVVLKTVDAEYPTRQQLAELRREHAILQRLQPVEGVIRVLGLEPHGQGNLALVTERFGRSLAHRMHDRAALPGRARPGEAPGLAPLPLAQVLDVAIAVTRTLSQLHEMDLVHKGIEPHNILLDDAGAIRLIDFGIASELSQERAEGLAPNRLEGSLPFLSPEQTGRMNRALDYRADFYALGVTLFQLLTGRLPFQAQTPLEWVHCHLSRVPPSPAEFVPTLPATVCAIVARLLAKNADERYQSGFGLVEDLGRCKRELVQTGTVSGFAIGRRDVSRHLQISQSLVGRETERAELLALLQQAAEGAMVLCTVAGVSGVGKSALVNELERPLVGLQGWMAHGKFDQFQRGQPYAALAMALRALTRQLLAEPAARRDAVAQALAPALGANGAVLLELAPDFEALIGPQPGVPELPATEARNRLHNTLVDALRALTRDQPLVLFLDDLQFGDAATLKFIRWLGASHELPHLMLVGAYRSDEVDVGHPVRLALDEIRASRPLHELVLRPLAAEPVERLVAGALHSTPELVRPLARLLHQRAEGNPFFLIEMLKGAERAGALSFDGESGRWRWNLDAVRLAGVGGNVVDFLLASLRRLTPGTQRVLELAACIGSRFDLRTLAVIHQQSAQATAAALQPALARQLVMPLHQDYRFVGHGETADVDETLNPSYRFQHDRVQQAAYALIDDDRRQAVHLSVGRLVLRHATATERREQLIDIVNHLNAGRRLIGDEAERLQLAQLNLEAAQQAQRAAAYETARGYLAVGQELLPADAWDEHHALAMALGVEAQQCAYLTGRLDEAEAAIEALLPRAPDALAKAELLSLRTRQYATTGKMPQSIRAAIAGLALLGVRFQADPSPDAIRREAAAVRKHLAGRRVAELIDAPLMQDARQKVALRLLMEIFPAAFLSGSGNLFPYLVLKAVNLSLRHGTGPESAFAYAAYGMLLCGALDDPALGFEYGELAVAMNDRLDDIALKTRVRYVYTMFVHHWSRHWRTMTPWFRRGIESGYASGDMLYLAYSAQDCLIWDPTLDLDEAEREHAELLKIVRQTGYQDSYDSGTLFRQMQRNFLGRTESLLSMNDAGFDEAQCLAGMLERRFMTGVANFHIYKTEICWFYGAVEQAWVHVREQDRLMASAMSLPQLVRYVIVSFLVRVAMLPQLGEAEASATRERLRSDLRRMARWAKHCPENFAHLQALMEAELARLDGHPEAAWHRYEAAIDRAREHGWRRDEAMAHERLARHLMAQGRRKAAEGYLRAAEQLYERWGAVRKVQHLHEEFVGMLGDTRVRATSAGKLIDASQLDMATVMKAAQTISGEIVLDQLWATTMRIMLESAGGQRGAFVVPRDGQLVVLGLVQVGGEDGEAPSPTQPLRLGSAEGARCVPAALVDEVLRTQAPVLLRNAAEEGAFVREPYVAAQRPRSVMALPLMRQGQCEGVVYLENRLVPGVFTVERLDVVRMLAAQVAISIENARLVDQQARLIAAQRQFVPAQFLDSLNHQDIARVDIGETVAKTMSVLFSDLRGFTPLAETLQPREVIGILNAYFAGMGAAIGEAGGFIDSFAGDEIKALFDAGSGGSADHAVRGAVLMWRALEHFNERAVGLGQPQLNMGIGVNTGPVVLGTVGGQGRLQCSVIGDTVNLASRIEQLTKVYGARVLVGQAAWAALQNREAHAFRLVDRVAVKGRVEPLGLYELLDADPPAVRAAKLATRGTLEAGMVRYAARDFDGALQAFLSAASEDPDDLVPRLFIERCERLRREPPPPEWCGVERLTRK
ncbi:AAA family ATPase [Inhella crocodyli]|uniref:AAA family ATPase n=1 Tax=Inhella crocodyli TaxID=2499851 RepID=UPI0013E3D87A|nr:AAA family ATPase [Inhella crocodyli]